jgi:hypothetical protein
MVEYAKQSSTCSVLQGFQLDPYNKDICFEWIQQFPYEWKVRDALGTAVTPYMAYSLVFYRIVSIQE